MNLKSKPSTLQIIELLILTYIFVTVGILVPVIITEAMEKPSDKVIVIEGIITSHTDNIYVLPTPKNIEAESYVAGFNEEWLSETPEKEVEAIIESIPEFSSQDIAILERVTMSESSTQPFETQVAVAQTIINRLHSGEFGDSIYDIVYTPYQYSTADNGDPNQQVKDAVETAINNPPYPSDMLYFREDYYHEWATDYKQIGVLFFSTES